MYLHESSLMLPSSSKEKEEDLDYVQTHYLTKKRYDDDLIFFAAFMSAKCPHFMRFFEVTFLPFHVGETMAAQEISFLKSRKLFLWLQKRTTGLAAGVVSF